MNEGDDETTHQDPRADTKAGEKQLFGPSENELPETFLNTSSADDSVVTWEASEYINHHKSANWYIALTVATVLLGVLLYLLIRDIWSLIVLAVMYLAISVYAKKEPRTLRYSVSSNGVTIGERRFSYDQFKSFSVMQESGVPSLSLDPTQRFMPAVSVYFAPDDADKIIDTLSKFLPHEHKTLSIIDRAILKLRF